MNRQQLEVKNFLMKAHNIDVRLKGKIDDVAELNELAQMAKTTLSDMPGSPNRNIHKTEDIILKILELQDEIEEDARELLKVKRAVLGCIRQIEDPDGQIILEERYIRMRKWEEIAMLLNMSMRKVFGLHDEMLKKITLPESVQ